MQENLTLWEWREYGALCTKEMLGCGKIQARRAVQVLGLSTETQRAFEVCVESMPVQLISTVFSVVLV